MFSLFTYKRRRMKGREGRKEKPKKEILICYDFGI
jgi:hypothetical protein